MPSARARAVPWSATQMEYGPQQGQAAAMPALGHPMPTPLGDQARSTVMIAALPGIATQSDGVQRQFYGGTAAPKGRIFVP